MRSRSLVLAIIAFVGLVFVLSGSSRRVIAAEQSPEVPAWLRGDVGEGEGQIAKIVLKKARALYQRKVSEGTVRNPCYFAMDATRPNVLGNGEVGRRFFIICEAEHQFRAISSGHGSGRDLGASADFANGRQCVKNFGNAMDSELTAGGAYVTAETKTSFKGYYRALAGRDAVFKRSFIQFEGEGETSNARQRAIGGHAAAVLKGVCLRNDPRSPYANPDGYVPFGTLTEYDGGRSNGCTSWSPNEAGQIVSMVRDDPTTLYIYPDASDVHAVAAAVAAHRPLSSEGLYWDASCLKQVRSPRFWSKETLEPIIAEYRREHPAPPPRPAPMCREP